MTADDIILITDFLGNEITVEQEERLMSVIKQDLSIADTEKVKANVSGGLYTELSMMEGEMGGFGRY